MRTYGFEREYFVKKGDEFVMAEGLPKDACGYLAEARGKASTNVLDAAFLMLSDEYELIKIARKKGLELFTDTPQKLPPQFLREAVRTNGKNIATDYTCSGKWNDAKWQHAGLHVHFGFETEFTYYSRNSDNPLTRTHLGEIPNIPRYIYLLDKRFKDIIKTAKRAPGLYELKPYGFEYRSLPASVPPVEVADFLKSEGL